MSISDEEAQLIELLKLGEQAAVDYWFSTFHPKLLKFITQQVPTTPEAEEIAQQTFLNCVQQLPLFRGESSLWTWMVSVARHEVADFYRKKYAKKALQTLPLSHALFENPLYDAHDTSQKVTQVLKKMSAYSRELLLKKYVDKKRVQYIAQELGKTVKSIESELFRARNEFRQLYIVENDV